MGCTLRARPWLCGRRRSGTARRGRVALLLQPGEHRLHPAVALGGVSEPQLGEDPPGVGLDGLLADEHRRGDRPVGAALGDQGEDLALPLGQGGERAVCPVASKQQLHDLRVDGRAAPRNAADRFGQVAGAEDPVLEQVAHAVRPVGQEVERVAGLDVVGEDQDSHGVPVSGADLPGGVQPLHRVRRRHPDVEDSDVRPGLVHESEQVRYVASLAHDVDVLVPEQLHQTRTEQGVVLGQHYAHGSRTSSLVPPAAGLVTCRVPPPASTRSARPRSPDPRVGSAPPTPSSSTSTRSSPPSARTSTRTRVACACFTTFVIASLTAKYAVVATVVGGSVASRTSRSAGTGDRSTSDSSAELRPDSVRIAGWMPRARSRSSSIASPRSLTAWLRTSWTSGSESEPSRASASRRASAMVTSRCCAPSCRSRSMRCRSSSPAATILDRDSATAVSWCCSSLRSRSLSEVSRTAATTAPTRPGSSSRASSCTSAATGAPSCSTTVTARPGAATGTTGRFPSGST